MGFNLNGDIGIGYSFLHGKRATLGLFAMFGLDYTKYSFTYEIDDWTGELAAKLDSEYALLHYRLGLDLTGAFRFTEHLGIFGNFGARWIAGGSSSLSLSGDFYGESISTDYDWDVRSKGLCYIMALGLCWTF